jgi:hypothetical protein
MTTTFTDPADSFSSAVEAAHRATRTSWLTEERVLLMVGLCRRRSCKAAHADGNLAQNNMSAVLAGVSGLFCLLVLGIVAVLNSRPDTRKALDRLSFRLLVYAMIAEYVPLPSSSEFPSQSAMWWGA